MSARAMGMKFNESMNLILKRETEMDMYFDPVVITSRRMALSYRYFMIG
jgi:hypothetical protein